MSIKQIIWNRLENGNYITDTELAKIYKGEPNFYYAETVKKEFFRLQKYLKSYNFHTDKTTEIRKGRRIYLVRNNEMKKENENKWFKIPKIYFDFIKKYNRDIIIL